MAELRVTGWDTQWRRMEAVRSPGTSRTRSGVTRGGLVWRGGGGYVPSGDAGGS